MCWRAAVAGFGGGRLTDVFLSSGGGVLEMESWHTADEFGGFPHHPRIESRLMGGLEAVL